ncbi:DUF3466 family protein [Vibrio sp. CAU 1672]|uniref:DUF3466 family protein n=1 Tax=Vibrio sp. CAU 1672 TaxID=3032594 RepID=UPI0023DAD6E8|nr:DUF3466 family protein [Vibrio sp. CAU 1672]MDF2152146.1 DUF3466 family protein [Vibrio sp. CAU 1672]
MNCSNKFKFTTIALMVGTAMNANAALYRVVEVQPEGITSEYKSAFGVAIETGNVYEDTNTPYKLGCFANGAACDETTFKLAGETRTTALLSATAVDGVSFREEVPFAMDARFRYIEDFDDIETYCKLELRYSTCESWASRVWQAWNQERYTLNEDSNALAFVEGAEVTNQYNNVINALISRKEITENGVTVEFEEIVGNQSVLNPDSNGSVSDKLSTRNTVWAPAHPNYVKKNDNDTNTDYYQSRAWAADEKYISGSVSYAQSNDYYGKSYYSKAAIWDRAGNVSLIDWPSNTSVKNDRLAQGSLRDFILLEEGSTTSIYGVGFNTYDSSDNYLEATVFKGTFSETGNLDDVTWKSLRVSGATSENSSNEYIYTNSVVQSVNSNGIAVGEAKRYGGKPNGGAAANRLFAVNDLNSPSANYFSGGIFFASAGGKIGGINNYNEIVGQLDAEDSREVDGKARRKRGFIYPYQATGTLEERTALFKDRAWYLDDLTNGGDYSATNNQFRIIDATDINEAGVISATATMCDGGYDTTAHNSLCKGGDANAEKVVAVKLVPIAGADQSDIQQRNVEQEAAERQGAGFGWLTLTLLGLFSFRRK